MDFDRRPAAAARDARRAEERGAAGDHWRAIARQWRHTGPPLRVSPEDVRAYAAAIDAGPERPPPRVLILGVTPELFALVQPIAADVVAVDRSAAMIDLVWPGPRELAQSGDWTDLALPAASLDLVLCDGGLHLLSWPDGQAALFRSLARVLAPGGRCVLRLFVPPEVPEDPAAILAELRRGVPIDVNALKLRLGMSLQHEPAAGVMLGSIWDAFTNAVATPATLGWSPEQALSLAAYRGSTTCYHFVTVAQAAALAACEAGFRVEAVATPRYALGERCPLVVFRRDGP